MVEQYEKIPVEVSAIQWTGDNLFEVTSFLEGGKPDLSSSSASQAWEVLKDLVDEEGLKIPTLEGVMEASVGDYIIEGVEGECYPCKPRIFLKTYKKVNK